MNNGGDEEIEIFLSSKTPWSPFDSLGKRLTIIKVRPADTTASLRLLSDDSGVTSVLFLPCKIDFLAISTTSGGALPDVETDKNCYGVFSSHLLSCFS